MGFNILVFLMTSVGLLFQTDEGALKAFIDKHGNTFHSSRVLGYHKKDSSCVLSKNNGQYGNKFFLKDGRFKSYYVAPCGNDCFRTAVGTYEFNAQTIRIKTDSIAERGYCSGDYSESQLSPVTYDALVFNVKMISVNMVQLTLVDQ